MNDTVGWPSKRSPMPAPANSRQANDPTYITDLPAETVPMNSINSELHTAGIEGSVNAMNDELLVLSARSGDANAFLELSKRHSNKILRRVYRITRNWEDSEDVLQESFLKAFIHLKNFEGRSSFSSWLTRIAINSALMNLRKRRRHMEIPIDTHKDPEAGLRWEPRALTENPERRFAERETEELLRIAILRLRPRFRDVVKLHRDQECSPRQIAQVLGISEAAVKSRLSRARMALRASLP